MSLGLPLEVQQSISRKHAPGRIRSLNFQSWVAFGRSWVVPGTSWTGFRWCWGCLGLLLGNFDASSGCRRSLVKGACVGVGGLGGPRGLDGSWLGQGSSGFWGGLQRFRTVSSAASASGPPLTAFPIRSPKNMICKGML